jgi:ABC-2 type transport system permease protein
MAESGWLRHALRMGVVEWRRSVRATRADSSKLVIYALSALFGLLFLVGSAAAIVFLLDDASGLRVTDGIRGNLSLLWLFLGFMVGQRAVSLYDRVGAEALVLTTVSARTTAVGLLVAETLRAVTVVAVPTLVLTGAFVYATGAVAAVVAVPVAVGLFLASAVAVGAALGWTAALLVARVPFVARNKTALGTVLVLVFFGAYMAFQLAPTGLPLDIGMLGLLPPGWVVDLFVVGSPVDGSLARVAAVLVGGPLAVAGLTAVAVRVATAYWYTDAVDPTDDGDGAGPTDGATPERAGAGRDALASAIAPVSVPAVAARPTRRVAQLSLLRTRRNPARLSFLLAPLAIVGSMLLSLLGAGSGALAPGSVPAVLPLAVAWLAGATFSLNPLGDEGPVLPGTLLSTVGGHRFVRGLSLPGALVGVPLAVLGTAAAAVATGYGPVDGTGLVVLALVLSIAALGLAPGVGTRYPRFDAVSAGRSKEVIPPALSAVAVYSLIVGLTGGFATLSLLAPALTRGLVAALVGDLPALVLSLLASQGLPTAEAAATVAGFGDPVRALDIGLVRGVGYAGPLVLVALLGYRGYRNAARRFDTFRVD